MDELGLEVSAGGAAEDARGESLLVFVVAGLRLALPVDQVAEVAVVGRVVAVPLVPDHLRGVTDWHGYALPVLDPGRLLKLPAVAAAGAGRAAEDAIEQQRTGRTAAEVGQQRMVVVSAAGMRAGLLCSQVEGIVEPLAGERRTPGAVPDPRLREFSRAEFALGSEICTVLDLAALLMAARVTA